MEQQKDIQDQIRSLEYATVKAPYEILNKKYRLTHKLFEKETGFVGAAKSIECLLNDQNVSASAVACGLEALENALLESKQKLLVAMDDEISAAKDLQSRNEHLRQPIEAKDQAAVEKWKNIRAMRFVAEYLMRTGYYNTAIEMCRNFNIEKLVNMEIFLSVRDVENSLRQHSTSKALAWCAENRSRLKKHRSNFEFNLYMQDFIEMIKRGQRKEALDFARKHFRQVDQEQLPDLQKMMLLLGFRDLQQLPVKYRSLLSDNRWYELVENFRQDAFRLFQIQSASLFSLVLQAGLSALKTHSCFSVQQLERSVLCPVCHPSLNRIAAQLPSSHHSQSKIRCRLTGQIMNDNNPPLVLPNGHVYSTRGLMEQARRNNYEVTCPVTGETFRFQQCEKLFLM